MKPRKIMRKDIKKKSKLKTIITVIIIVVVLILIAIQLFVFKLYNEMFHQRFSSADNMGFNLIEDYDNLTYEKVEFKSDEGQNIVGYFYQDNEIIEPKAVILFNHGFGSGHVVYLPQIEYLARNGYLVLGFDKTGNDESGGEYVKGLQQGVIDLEYALDYVREDERSKDLPIMLYGHSWGAYSSLAILEEEKDITAVVSLSSFNKSHDMLIEEGSKMYGDAVEMLAPFLRVCDIVNFGSDAFMSSEKGIKSTNADVLVIHSDDDKMIDIDNSFNVYREKFSDKDNIAFIELTGRGHTPFSTDESDQYNIEIKKLRNEYISENPDLSKDEAIAVVMQDYDKEIANQIDENLMNKIVEFCDNSIEKE